MPNLDENLAKSLDEIEAKADQVLEGSQEVEEEVSEGGEVVEKGLKPDEVASDDDKADDSDDSEDKGDDEDEEDDTEDNDDKEETKKSITEEFESNETIAKSLEVSEFLSEFTRVHTGVLDNLREDVVKSLETSTHTATILAKSFNAIMKSQEGLTNLVKSQANELKEAQNLIKSLQERLDDVEKQPAVRKSVVTTLEKSFEHSAGITSEGAKQELSKSEKIQRLTDMAISGQNGVTVNDVVTYESTGQLRPDLEQYLV